jgi:hypothetical protein
LLRHITASDTKNYQPANIHFGLFDATLFDGVSGQKRDGSREKMAAQALRNFSNWKGDAALEAHAPGPAAVEANGGASPNAPAETSLA